MSIKLDIKDKKILYELDMDARQSISSIAKRVGLSKEVVNYRIRRMEKEGLIDGYYAIIEYSKLGYMYCRLIMTLQNISPKEEEEIREYAKKSKKIGLIVTAAGEWWDLVFVIWAKNIIEIKEVLDDFMLKYGKFIKEKEITIATKVYHFRHKYLYNNDDSTCLVVEQSKKEVKIDSKDLKILEILSKEGRKEITEIAKILKTTINTVKYRLKKLLDNNIIVGFRANININILEYQRYKVMLLLYNIDKNIMKKIIYFLGNEKNIVYITEAVGRSDLEFEIDVKNINELYEIMKKIRTKFSEVIKDHKLGLTLKEEGINYLPTTG